MVPCAVAHEKSIVAEKNQAETRLIWVNKDAEHHGASNFSFGNGLVW